MVTIYELLEVNEDATKEEIEQSYHNLLLEYKIDPILTEQENKENEMILNRLKMAYEILMNDEKRDKYDKDLAKKRAEELIKNVEISSVKNESKIENNMKSNSGNDIKQSNVYNEEDDVEDDDEKYIEDDEEAILSNKEKKEVRKAAEAEFRRNLKKAQKVEEEYNEAYNQAYNDYLKKMGYKTKEPITLKKIKNTIIVIAVVILVCFIAWNIPPINKLLVDLYESNFIIRALVNIIKALFNGIISIFK